jgi:hypothetical protein
MVPCFSRDIVIGLGYEGWTDYRDSNYKERFNMLALSGFFDSQDRFVPDEPAPIPHHKRVTITIEEEEGGLASIPSSAWETFFRELEAIDGEDIPDDFVEQFRMSNFRTAQLLNVTRICSPLLLTV